MVEFFENFYNVLATIFTFIGNIIFTIINTITTIADIINSIGDLALRIVTILPNELNTISVIFITLHTTILIYKLFRKG